MTAQRKLNSDAIDDPIVEERRKMLKEQKKAEYFAQFDDTRINPELEKRIMSRRDEIKPIHDLDEFFDRWR